MKNYNVSFTVCVNVDVSIADANASRRAAREAATKAINDLLAADENALSGWNWASGLAAEVTRIGWETEGEADVDEVDAEEDEAEDASRRILVARGWTWDEGGPHWYRSAPGASALLPYQYAKTAEEALACD